MSESEARSLPGGLASVKKQFESREFASSTSQSAVAQVHFEQRSVQVRAAAFLTFLIAVIHDERVHQNHVAASYGNHYNETVMVIGGEDLPKVSTQSLKQQYEKTIEEAAPAKEIKVDVDFNQFQWAPVTQSSTSSYDASSTVKTATRTASSVASASSFAYELTDHFPPPPSNLPQDTPDHVSSQPQEPASQHKHANTKEQYFKHKSTAELKRLYKHINPEVRKNLQEDFLSELTEAERKDLESEEMIGDVQQACYLFENDGNGSSKCSSPDREYVEWDEILKGEVQSMRWMFENKPLDTIKDDNPGEDQVGNIAQQEIIAGKDVRHTAWMFETRPIDALGTDAVDATGQSQKSTADLARGDVRTATWLFETQPLDYLNKIYQEDEQETAVVVNRSITGGDVKTARYLFETQHLDSLGKTETIEESNFLNLKSELEEVKGDVKTTTRMFETQPMCVIRGDSGEMLEITTIRREETEKGDVKTSRWMFETQPLDIINKDPAVVKLICGISMEDDVQVGVNKGRWLFETKTLDTIRDEEWESSRKQKEDIIGTDVRKHCLVFETQAMDTLKDNANARPLPSEEIVGGDVQTAKHLFETVPMENLKELLEVGKLQKMVASEEEKGDVRHQKWVFESEPLENIREEKKEITRTVNLEAVDKIDVTNYKERFESMDLSKCEGTQKIQVEGVTSGSVRSNRVLFESTPMYAMQDSSGHYHEVKTVRREEIVKGDVRSCRWMFETRPIDEFDESINRFQIIKGISKQEVESGDVKTAKWLFETQALDSIKSFGQCEDEEHACKEGIEIEKGDVKTCRWLFETQPMDALYEKMEKSEVDVEEVQRGDVKTCTWLFETQTLDNIRDHTESETILKTCTVKQDDVQGKDVRLARFLFETENLENLTGEDGGSFRRVTEIDVQSGDVSRMKYIFENRSSDIMSSSSGETMQRLKTQQVEEIQKGDVVNCTWMFEHHPIDNIRDESADAKESRTVTDVKGGDVDKGRFIFETYSLDEIKEDSTETDKSKITSIFREEVERGDVKNYTMMFETQPLYAICDKEGRYHEVTTVTKEEIIRGDVVGARWQFETKPLDSIRDSEEVYVIKAVTEEGINKGDVNTARWRFETQPLDEITEEGKVRLKSVADIQGGDVKTNKQRFETDEMSQRYVKTVSVSEIQKGDVRSATWMFETRTIDEIRGEGAEYDGMERVTKEEVMKGDVKQSVWLFEKQPLDTIKETDGTELVVTKEQIPQADVKSTTWLFESTPFNEFNESEMKRTEIMGKSIKDTLEELYSQKMVESQGVLIEADEIGDVRMAKYNLMNQKAPQIQREETIRGDLSNIMMNLLSRREVTERGITIDSEERGNINTTVRQLFNQERGINVEKEEIVRGDIQEAVNNLLKSEGSSKRGILIQEDEKGDVKLTIYSLLNKGERASMEKEDIVQGNVSRTLHRLLSNSGGEDSKKIRVGDKERGNVSFYSTCIESGALDYLKQLQYEPGETQEESRKENIIGGDIQETKILLRKSQQEIGRTVAKHEIVPGDVHSNVKVFMTEPAVTYRNLEKRDIVKGDLNAALDSLTQAMNQKVLIEKEEVVKGDIPTTLKSLEEAQHQAKEMEKPEIIRGDIKGALESLEKSATTNTEVTVEDLVPGDIKGTLKSPEEAKKAVKEVEKEEILKGDIHIAMQSLHEATSEKKTFQHQVSEQGDVRGTIQLLLEPTSPRLQRRGSVEGDVKTSIKCLYEGQEATRVEKEEVVKGDVRGAIKNLMQRKQYSNLKRTHPAKKAKVPVKNPLSAKPAERECLPKAQSEREGADPSPAVEKLSQSAESQKHTERHNESKSVKTQVITQEAHSVTVAKTDNTTGAAQQMSTREQKQQVLPPQKTPAPKSILVPEKQMTISEQAAVDVMKEVQNIRTSTHTNISSKQVCETKSIKQVHATATERTAVVRRQTAAEQTGHRSLATRGDGGTKKVKPEIHFPPPPSSPPPPSESELSLPPPPSPEGLARPPSVMRQDSDLPPPPPPPPHEGKSRVKKIETSERVQSEVTASTTKIPSIPAVSPKPPKKSFVPPIKLPPPPEPAPPAKPKTYARKFKTPLMLAEERYRQQMETEEIARSNVTTPTSPPVKRPSSAAARSAETEEAVDASKAKSGEATAVSTDGIMPAKNTDSQIPLSKPLISVLNKKSQSGSSNVSVDKTSVTSHHARMWVTSSVTEQQFIKKSGTRCVTAVQENVNLQTAAALTAEDVRNRGAPLTPGAKMSPSQSTKIPKAAPSFKVKTFKMPTETNEERCDTHSQREESQTKGIQRSHLTSARTEMRTEMTVKEKKSHVTAQDVEQDVHVEKGEQVQRHVADVKPSPPVTLSMPEEGKMAPAPAHSGHVSVSVSRGCQQSVRTESVRTERVQRHEEAVLTESVVQQRREAAHARAHKAARGDESRSGKISDLEKCRVMQRLLAEMKELEGAPGKMDSDAVGVIMSKLPDWAMGSDEKRNFGEIAQQQSKKKLKEMMVYVRNICHAKLSLLEESAKAAEQPGQERDAAPPRPDAGSPAATSATVSKISIGSSLQERKVHREQWEASDRRVSSPLASVRTPSPTFISIESRRIDSQSRVTPSPPPFRAVGTPPPPPRRSHTPTAASRATPSPTLCRSEKLTKLRDTTSKLSRSMTPPPPPPAPASDCVFAEREQCSPFQVGEPPADGGEEGSVDMAEMVDSMMTVRDKKSFFEEAQKVEGSRMYTRKDPIDIPERLGPDAEEGAAAAMDVSKADLPKVDLSKLVNRFESPQPKVYARKEPIVIAERLGSDTEDAEADPPRTDEVHSFNVRAIKNVFETGEHGSQAARELREIIERREPEAARPQAAARAETTVVTELFCAVDDATAHRPGSSAARGNPPSYADVVRGAAQAADVPADVSTEELLRSFQQSWSESQGVFQNLGFSVTEQRSSQVVTRQQATVVTGKAAPAWNADTKRARRYSEVSQEGRKQSFSFIWIHLDSPFHVGFME
uniref:Xin actin binding repeat containing 2a n=1 Tax=Gasterosteus aculeatus aculeatus TaxID=481459 RepID=G3PLB3_GASAC